MTTSPTIDWQSAGVSQADRATCLVAAAGSNSSQIATWVADNFVAQTVDGVTVLDLSTGARS